MWSSHGSFMPIFRLSDPAMFSHILLKSCLAAVLCCWCRWCCSRTVPIYSYFCITTMFWIWLFPHVHAQWNDWNFRASPLARADRHSTAHFTAPQRSKCQQPLYERNLAYMAYILPLVISQIFWGLAYPIAFVDRLGLLCLLKLGHGLLLFHSLAIKYLRISRWDPKDTRWIQGKGFCVLTYVSSGMATIPLFWNQS